MLYFNSVRFWMLLLAQSLEFILRHLYSKYVLNWFAYISNVINILETETISRFPMKTNEINQLQYLLFTRRREMDSMNIVIQFIWYQQSLLLVVIVFSQRFSDFLSFLFTRSFLVSVSVFSSVKQYWYDNEQYM